MSDPSADAGCAATDEPGRVDRSAPRESGRVDRDALAAQGYEVVERTVSVTV